MAAFLIIEASIRMLHHGCALIVDGPVMRKLIRGMLADCRFSKIDEAGDGAQAITAINKTTYSLIVADWNMSPISGLDLLTQVRARPLNQGTPFIMMTGKGQKRFAAALRDNGTTRYIEKPFSAEDLKARFAEASLKVQPPTEKVDTVWRFLQMK